jgi:hypothetical protein
MNPLCQTRVDLAPAHARGTVLLGFGTDGGHASCFGVSELGLLCSGQARSYLTV